MPGAAGGSKQSAFQKRLMPVNCIYLKIANKTDSMEEISSRN